MVDLSKKSETNSENGIFNAQSVVKKDFLEEIIEVAGIPVHRHANIVPFQFIVNDLVESISRVGQLEAITTYKGEILDGRRRAAAISFVEGVEPRFDELYVEGKELSDKEIYDIVLAKNTRRNLSKTQRALVAAREIAKGAHKKIGYPNRLDYAKKIWDISKQVLEDAEWILKNYPQFADAMFETGIVEYAGKTFKSVYGLKKWLSNNKPKSRHESTDDEFGHANAVLGSAIKKHISSLKESGISDETINKVLLNHINGEKK